MHPVDRALSEDAELEEPLGTRRVPASKKSEIRVIRNTA
jgi:hypothetical protein